jgi:hypothetical protein
MELKRSISEYRSGRVRGLDEALDNLEIRHLGPGGRRRPRSIK